MRRSLHSAGLVVLLVVCAGTAPAAASVWSIRPTPNGAGVASTLNAVSCASPRACVAVGSYMPHASQYSKSLILAESWNGTAWTIMPIPMPARTDSATLDGVSCPAVGECVAVGSYRRPGLIARTLIERLSAGAWSIQPSPNLGDGIDSLLDGVSCSAIDACTAVGFGGSGSPQPLAVRWNGARWQPQPVPAGSSPQEGLYAVSCPTARFCMATGFFPGLAEVWDGTSWAISSESAGGFGLRGVSCTSPTGCQAVGYADVGRLTLIVASGFDGTNWTDESISTASQSSWGNGVSCLPGSLTNCFAVGSSGQTLVEQFDGATWTVQPTPNPSTAAFSELRGVSCVPSAGASVCMAVGEFLTTSSLTPSYTLAEQMTSGSVAAGGACARQATRSSRAGRRARHRRRASRRCPAR